MRAMMRNCLLLSVLAFLVMAPTVQAQDVYLWNDQMLYETESPWQLAGWGNLTASYDVQFYYDTRVDV